MAKIKLEPQLIYKELQNARNYKSSERIYDIVRRNEKYDAGEQWPVGMSSDTPQTTYNICRQARTTQVATVMANQLTINRSADELSTENEQVQMAARAFTEIDKRNWERLKIDSMNEEVLKDSYIAGLGGTHWYWDDDIITGNDFITKGDIAGETIDSISYYASNPNETDVQKQDWNILSQRLTVRQIREIAKTKGVPEDQIQMIQGDETTTYEGYSKAQNEQDNDKINSNMGDLITKYWKELKPPFARPTVHMTKVTNSVVICEPVNTELERYPIALMPWFKRKKFIYATSPLTEIIPNQQVGNKQASIRHLHAQLMALPKVVVNGNMIDGFSNIVGGIYRVNAQPGADLSNAIDYIQPAAMSFDADKSIDDSFNRTRDIMGINQAVTGEANPDNFRAIVAQQKAAGVPLETIKRQFIQYIEDVALIWEDFYKTKYNMIRKVVVEEDGKNEVLSFTGTDFKDIFLKTKIDVGSSTQWSELLQIDALNTARDRGDISPLQYFERLPKNIIPQQEKLIEELGGGDEAKKMKKIAMNRLIVQFMATQPPEIQQQFQQLPPEEQEQFAIQLINGGGQGEMQPMQQ